MTENHQRDEPADVASPEEVLETFTAIMRSGKGNEQMKAAETLAKHYGLLTPRENAAVPAGEAIAAVEEVMKALEVRHAADA